MLIICQKHPPIVCLLQDGGWGGGENKRWLKSMWILTKRGLCNKSTVNKCFSTCCEHASLPLTHTHTYDQTACITDNSLHSWALRGCTREFMCTNVPRIRSLTHTHTHTPNDQNPCPSLTFHPSPPPFGAHMLTICANLSHWNTFVKGNDSLEGCNFRNGAVPCGVIADCWLAWTRLIWASFWENWENSFLHRDYSVLGKQVTQSVTEQWHEEVTQLHTISL